MSISKLELITFDFTRTLFKPAPSFAARYLQAFNKFGIGSSIEKKLIEPAFKKSFNETNTEFPCYGKHDSITSKHWWDLTVERTLENCLKEKNERIKDVLPELQTYLFDQFASANWWEEMNGTRTVLKYLKDNYPDISLGVISNFDNRLHGILEDLQSEFIF
eukprot:TRINITY_DN22778_c0_g1_i1.p1 TRINITY_DN22778_c0_g1~~TRINITY_DN22778_c0_g1_i1.p1  ORF type:complete len:162 (+),score=38.54 TRINITY_DN22778_c0_g1_i1:32-517(+)